MGRLIDADDVERLMQRAMYYDNSEVTESNYKKIAKQLVDGIPTAYDVEKVKHQLRCKTFSSGISTVIEFEDVMNIIQKGGAK